MLIHRSTGLVQMHIWASAVLGPALFLLMAASRDHLSWIRLNPAVNLEMCALTIAASMLASGRFVSFLKSRIHRLGWAESGWLATRQVATMVLIGFTVIVATKDRTISRLFLAQYIVLSWFVLLLANRFVPRLLANASFRRHTVRTVFVGHMESLDRIADWLRQKELLGVIPVGFLTDDHCAVRHAVSGPCLGTTMDLACAIEAQRVAQVIVLDVPACPEAISRITAVCQETGCRLLVYDSIAERLPIPMMPTIECGHLFLTNRPEPLEDPANRLVKRIFDVSFSLAVAVSILPVVTALVWIMQRLQAPGPLFFVRPRGGQGRSEFGMLKFRSMYFDPSQPLSGEAIQATKGDARVFPFGAFLRRTSLDELPQFLNVLKGDMSVVGPRPHLPRHDHEFSKVARGYRSRHLVKPGITGLAQIRGYRGEIREPSLLERRVELDLFYIVNWSIWLDVRIAMKTMWQMIFPPATAC
jgi:exopolysaccharide biosynthesis polyprenyl glycosylphosphotransferase